MGKYGQAGKPQGVLGKFFGFTMNWYNKFEHRQTIDDLSIQPNDQLLEIGYGTGQALYYASKRLAQGKIIGLDHSETMREVAARRNREEIGRKKVELRVGDARHLDFPDQSFDKVYSIHCIYFWEEPDAVLKEINRVLRKGGKAAITVRTGKGAVYEKFTDENIKGWMEQCGFHPVEIRRYGGKRHKASVLIGEKI